MKQENRLAYESEAERARQSTDVASIKAGEAGIYESKIAIHEPALVESLAGLSSLDIGEAERTLQASAEQQTGKQGDDRRNDKIQDVLWGLRALGNLRILSPEHRSKRLEKLAKTEFYRMMPLLNTESLGLSGKITDALFQMAITTQNMAMARFPNEWHRQEEANDEAIREEILKKRDELLRVNVE